MISTSTMMQSSSESASLSVATQRYSSVLLRHRDIGITSDQFADAAEWAKNLSLEETFKASTS